MKKNILTRCFIFFMLVFVGAMPFSIAITQNALFLSLLFWMILSVREKKHPFVRTPFDWFFVAFLAAETVAMLFSSVRTEAFVHMVKRILLISIVYLISGSVQNKKLLRWMLVSLFGVMAIVSLIGIRKYLAGVGGLEGRLSLFRHYMTSGGILMIIGLLTAAFVVVRTPVRWRLAALACTAVVLIPLVFTFTRSSWLGFLAGAVVMILLMNWKWTFALIPLLALFFLLAPISVRDRLGSIYNLYHPNNIERTYMWKAGLRMIHDRPLTGYGDIDLGRLYEQYHPPEARERSGHLHNNFIMFGAIMGIPGLLVMLGLFATIFIVMWKVLRSIPPAEWLFQGTVLGCMAAFTGFQVNGLFEWNFGDSEIAMMLWLTVGLVLAVQRMLSAPKTTVEA